MKSNVMLKIPFKGGKYATIKLPEPCIYCGKPVNEDGFTWTDSQEYNHKKWGISNKFGDHQVYDLKINGLIQKGTVRVEVPYCAEHTEGVKTYRTVERILSLLGLIAGIVVTIIYWQGRVDTFYDAVRLVILPLFGAGIGYIISTIVNKILSLFMGKKRDYPSFDKGHWGFTVGSVTVDKGELGIGPIEYYLSVSFLNEESAKRTMEAFPGSRESKIGKAKSL